MGVKLADYPAFAHLPFVMGQDNAKLSKRNGEVSIAWYREQGYLPEAICNYLAVLGWSPGDDRENISMKELTELFTVEKVHSSPARFDMKKLEAINGDKIRALSLEEFATWTLPFLIKANVIAGTDEEKAKGIDESKQEPKDTQRETILEMISSFIQSLNNQELGTMYLMLSEIEKDRNNLQRILHFITQPQANTTSA
jgi:glutamyl/glutaminyl-tRNA synthetase